MLEAQKQQHLRTLRRSLNRAVTSLKEGRRVVCHAGWGFGKFWWEPWLELADAPPKGFEGEPTLVLPPPESEGFEHWLSRFPSGARDAIRFFWPGPLAVRTRFSSSDESVVWKATAACPWHPLAKELLSRAGALLWEPVSPALEEELARAVEPKETSDQVRYLLWPEPESKLALTVLDLSTRPWRLMDQGFIEGDELLARIGEPVVLSEERAFPKRPIRTYVPEGKTIIVEAADHALLPEAVQALRQQVPPDAWVRIYLDTNMAHSYFPDDREVRVYGELTDPERARRRLQAMLERQRRRLGKRVLLIGVAEMGAGAESFRADLEKLADRWLKVEDGKELVLECGDGPKF